MAIKDKNIELTDMSKKGLLIKKKKSPVVTDERKQSLVGERKRKGISIVKKVTSDIVKKKGINISKNTVVGAFPPKSSDVNSEGTVSFQDYVEKSYKQNHVIRKPVNGFNKSRESDVVKRDTTFIKNKPKHGIQKKRNRTVEDAIISKLEEIDNMIVRLTELKFMVRKYKYNRDLEKRKMEVSKNVSK